jgi:hypothetical protein
MLKFHLLVFESLAFIKRHFVVSIFDNFDKEMYWSWARGLWKKYVFKSNTSFFLIALWRVIVPFYKDAIQIILTSGKLFH